MLEVTVLGSGSSGNAIVLRNDDQALLVDAGFSGIELERRLAQAGVAPSTVIGILVSHEHGDHVQAARIFAKRHGGIRGYANSLTAGRLRDNNTAPEQMVVFANGAPFEVGAFRVEAFSVCHDAIDPVGFVISCAGRRIGIATDLGYYGKLVPLKLRDCNLLIVESNHDPELLRNSERPARLQHRIYGRRGHLSNHLAAALLRAAVGPATQHIITVHLSDECNHRDLVETAMQTCLSDLQRPDINLMIADQDGVCPTITL